MKKCAKCKQEKELKDFNKSSSYKGKKYLQSYCKECFKKIRTDFKKRNPWSITWRGIHTRCNLPNHDSYQGYGDRGIKNLITRDELKTLWFRDNAGKMEKPSIDRIDSSKDYTFENCRYIEHRINSGKRVDQVR